MRTQLADFIRDTPEGREADAILRKCVHCGFCTATCPTFVLLGDERDSPRGRIYMIKSMLEGDRAPTASEVRHVDRCLSCLSCMTTCPPWMMTISGEAAHPAINSLTRLRQS